MDNLLSVKIMSPTQLYFNDKALALSSKNSDGKFDIIPQHANFITIIENQPITVLTKNNQRQTFNFSQAIIYQSKNQVTVFAEPLSSSQVK